MKKLINTLYRVFSYTLGFLLLLSLSLNLISFLGFEYENISVISLLLITNFLIIFKFYKPFNLFE